MTNMWIQSISLFGPGLPGWAESSVILRDLKTYDPKNIPPITSKFLTPNNKRRTSPHMHVAIQAAEYALMDTGVDEKSVSLVFCASEGDLDIGHDNLMALTKPEKEMSPQKFQNVILNAAAGHLGVFMNNNAGSTTVSGSLNCFSVALVQAYTELFCDAEKVLLVAHDASSQSPYSDKARPFFGVGMLLSKVKPNLALASMKLSITTKAKPTIIDHPWLDNIRVTTPSAACLPLLIALAQNSITPVELYYSEDIGLEVTLCF